jgi:hypothetical protein
MRVAYVYRNDAIGVNHAVATAVLVYHCANHGEAGTGAELIHHGRHRLQRLLKFSRHAAMPPPPHLPPGRRRRQMHTSPRYPLTGLRLAAGGIHRGPGTRRALPESAALQQRCRLARCCSDADSLDADSLARRALPESAALQRCSRR